MYFKGFNQPMTIRIFILCILIFLGDQLRAQDFTTFETNPTSLRWQQLNTEHFRVLFPKGFDAQAQRMANTLEAIHAPEAKSLGTQPRKISVVLQNQSSLSNAFVSITPRRSEFYTMPSQDYNFVGNNDWMNILASHEYRHVVQFQHANRGFNKLASIFFGNNLLAGLSYLAVPQWFWEGDAVATETAFTPSGRGRIPNFDLVFRTNLMEGRTFNYNKQYLRSYKHNIPNHYVLGYHMVSYLRKRTGNAHVWGEITRKAWTIPFKPFTFSSSLKTSSGLYVNDLYQQMAKDLKSEWQKQLDTLKLTSFEKVNQRSSEVYTDYHYPQQLEDGSVLAVKSGIGDIEQLVRINHGVEEKIFVQGLVNESGMLSAVNNRVVWNEYRFDPRWRVKNFSVIVAYDIDTKIKRVISSHSRYASAALSPDGYKVATIETGTDYATKLIILDFFSGKVEKEFLNPDHDFLSMPRWTQDGKEIILLRTNSNGKALASYRLIDGNLTNLTEFSQENKGHPVPVGHYILYNSPISGIDNIYAIDRNTRATYQITCSKYGAYNPSLSRDGKTIFYNEQSRNGMDVVKIPFDPSSWKVWNDRTDHFATAKILTEQEGSQELLKSVPQQTFPTKKYSRLRGIINPYSWGAYIDNTLAQADIGISSRDILGTTSISTGYVYDINERTGLWRAGVSYQTFYPIIDFEVTKGAREANNTILGRDIKFHWKENGAIGGLRIPLLLTRSKYHTELEVSNSIGMISTGSFENEVSKDGNVISTGTKRYVYANDTLIYSFNDRVDNAKVLYNRFIISYSHALKKSRRDFNPRFAQSLVYENYNTTAASDYEGRLSALRGVLYFPGLFKHHSLFFRGGYQKSLQSTSLSIYSFRNRIFKPRGHAYPRDSEFVSLSTNYQLPVWYPDISIGPLVNIQRIKANLFYDYGSGKGRSYYYQPISATQTKVYYSNNSAVYQSIGAELTFDVNVIRILPQLELGVRATYLQANIFNSSGLVFEFMLGNIPF